MPKASVLQGSFTSGELSPLMYGEPASERYKAGLATCLNYIPTLQGPVNRRPGTKYVNQVADSTKPPVLIPFQFSSSQAYVFEFGDKYIRFYNNGGQVITGSNWFNVNGYASATGSSMFPFTSVRSNSLAIYNETILGSSIIAAGAVLQLSSPYAYQDVPVLKWAQNFDTLYLSHPNYPPYKLQRRGAEVWDLKQVPFHDGPYLPLNSYLSVGDKPTTIISFNGVGIAPDVKGALVNTDPIQVIRGITFNSQNNIRVNTLGNHPYVSGDLVFISGVTSTVEANNFFPTLVGSSSTQRYWSVSVVDSTDFDLVGSLWHNAFVGSSGIVQPALFTGLNPASGFADEGRSVRLNSFTGSSSFGYVRNIIHAASATIVQDINSVTIPLGSSIYWQLGTWGGYSGVPSYPSTCTFHQDRLCFAGAPGSPQEIDASQPGLYEFFSANDPNNNFQVTAASALQFSLNSQDLNQIKWMRSETQGLIAGTHASEWQVSPSANAEALTPTNISAMQSSFYGSNDADAVQAANATIYIQRSGRKVREMNYFFQLGTFRSTDITELSEHITLPTVNKLVVQKETQPLIWAQRSDGNLLSMTYNRDDLSIKVGWARHQLGGKSDAGGTNPLVTSLAVIPSPDTTFDQMWLVVKRYISGASIYTIETMTKIFDDSTLQEDSFQLDCGSTYYNAFTINNMNNQVSPMVVQANGHNFTNGQTVKITNVVGLSQTATDINGNVSGSSFVNGKTFLVGSSVANFFSLFDFNNNPVNAGAYSGYVSGGSSAVLVKTITGLNYLVGETVGIVADGGIHPPVIVNSTGGITLSYPAAKVQIGYTYNSDGQLLRPEAGAADGTSFGKIRRPTRAAVMMRHVGELQLGTAFNDLVAVELSTADQNQADNAPPLFNGIVREGLGAAYGYEGQVCFRQNSGLPGVIQAVVTFMEEFDI